MNKQIKGMVMALDAHEVLIMTPNGQFLRFKKPADTCVVGMEILCEVPDENEKWTRSLARRLRMAAASLVPSRSLMQGALAATMVLSLGVGSWAYPTGKLYMEVNPSVGLTYNVYHRIIGTQSYNSDGAKVMETVSIYGKSLTNGVSETFEAIEAQGYIQSGEEEVSGVIIGYTDPAVADEAVEAIGKVSEAVQKPVTVAAVAVKPEAEKISTKVQSQKQETVESKAQWTPVKVAIAQQSTDKTEKPKALADGVSALKDKSTAKIISENGQSVKLIKNERIDKVKKAVEARKEKKRQQEQLQKPEKVPKPEKAPKPEKVPKPEKAPKLEQTKPETASNEALVKKLEQAIQKLKAEREEILQSNMGKNEKKKKLKQIEKQLEKLQVLLKKILKP